MPSSPLYHSTFTRHIRPFSSKDFAPPHVETIIKNLVKPYTADHFTIGVTSPETALPIGKPFDFLPTGTKQCIFWGLGSDVTVRANK